MRILLAQNSPYYPAHGGGDKSNRLLIEALAARGHACLVVARTGSFGLEEHRRYLADLAGRGVPVVSAEAGVTVFRLNGVEVHVATNHPNLRGYFSAQAAVFDPDVIVTSTDDPAQLLLEAALKAGRARVVYLTRATLAVPFGPDCAFPSEAKTATLRQVDGVVGVSQYVADYIRRYSGIEAVHFPISLMESGPFAELGRFDNEFVTLVNPCAVKGISIFLALAEQMPDVAFAAVPTWGTNEADRALLRGRSNVHVLNPVDDIDLLLARTRVLLAPSLWAEARSRIVVEAMLRGVPVIASDIGGIPEAKMGVDYLLPVRPIEKYSGRLDEQMVPVAEVPEQEIGPWRQALGRLLTDQAHYEQLSRESRAAALRYVENLNAGPFESFLLKVLESPRRERGAWTPGRTEPAAQEKLSVLDRLSPGKRRLLALRLKKNAAPAAAPENAWFPNAEAPPEAALRLFCFPHAGGGAAAYLGWTDGLPGAVALYPARLPGRESRHSEPAMESMEALVESLGQAIRPLLGANPPFAFFGHSMGAAIAFELARYLRRHKLPGPEALFVSGARAPQYRRGHVPAPDPTDEEFLAELRRLEGIPKDVLDNPELLALILPALRADSALYRRYVYREEPPLPCPIRAYGGADDPNINPEHLEAWKQQTTASFRACRLPGGHFFPQTAQREFLERLSSDIEELRLLERR